MARKFDVAVVGAGAFGAWTAFHLRAAGKSVALIDGYGPANNRASSGGESRIIRMGYGGSSLYSRWSANSLEQWQELFRRTNQQLFFRTGMLWMAAKNDAWLKSTIATLLALNMPHEILSPRDLRRRFPAFSPSAISEVAYEPESGAILARRAVQLVAREAVEQGVEYLPQAVMPISGKQAIDFIRTHAAEKIGATNFVFACGPWLPKVFPFLRNYIFPTRQEVLFFGASGTKNFQVPLMPAWYDQTAEAYGIPDLESRGPKVAFDALGSAFDPDFGSRIVSPQSVNKMRRYLRKRIPALASAPVSETRVCQYENTRNRDFLIDRHPKFENCWIAGGGSGHGFKHGPAVGQYVASQVLNRAPAESRFLFITHSPLLHIRRRSKDEFVCDS